MNQQVKTALQLITAPASEPVTPPELKSWANVSIDEDDGLLTGLLMGAREDCENWCKRAFITQKWRLYLEAFPFSNNGSGGFNLQIDLPKPPLQSVESVSYLDTNGDRQTLVNGTGTKTGDYVVDTATEPGRITVQFSRYWPTTYLVSNPVQIDFTAGYGDTGDAVPERAKMAIKALATHFYQQREPVITGLRAAAIEVPMHVDRLLYGLKVELYS